MRKILQVMAVIISGTLLSDAFAVAAPPVPTYGGHVAPDPASNGQVLGNDAFKSTVDKLGTQTNNKLNQTVQQQLKSAPPPPTNTAPPEGNDAAAKPKQNSDVTDSDTAANAANKTPNTQPAAATPQQTTIQPATPPAQQSSQPATSSEVYTGFGSGGQTNQKSKSSGGSQDSKSSNWNVGY